MNYKNHLKGILTLAFPIMLSHLGNMLVGVVDTIMVGKLGVVELASISLANAVLTLATIFAVGVSMGLTPIIAKINKINAPINADSKSYFFSSLYINLTVGISMFLILLLFGKYSYLLNQPEEILDLTRQYLILTGLSLIFLMIFQTAKQYTEGIELTKIAFYIALLSNLINIVFNYLLIYGKFGFHEYGLQGAAIATLISRIVLSLLMIIYFIKVTSSTISDFYKFRKYFSFTKMKKLLKLGLPIGIHFSLEFGAFSFAWLMMGWIGTTALSAHQIAINLSGITYTMAIGLASAITVKYAKQYYIGNQIEINKMISSSFLLIIVMMSCFALIFIFFNDLLPKLYIDNNEVIRVTSILLLIAAFFQISDGLQVIALGILRGMEDVNIPTIITLICYWIVAIPLSYFLGFKLNYGAIGIWIGLLVGLTFSSILLIRRIMKLTNYNIYDNKFLSIKKTDL